MARAERLERQHTPPVGVGNDHRSPVTSQHPGDLRRRLSRLREVGRAHDRDGAFAGAFFQLRDLLAERDAARVGVAHADEQFVDAAVWPVGLDFQVSPVRRATELK